MRLRLGTLKKAPEKKKKGLVGKGWEGWFGGGGKIVVFVWMRGRTVSKTAEVNGTRGRAQSDVRGNDQRELTQ